MNLVETKRINLSQNENPLGPSPKSVQAILDNYALMSQYPDAHSFSVKTELAKKLNTKIDNIFVSAGLIEALDILIRNFVSKDENIIVGQYSFAAYRQLAHVFDIETRFSEMKEYRMDIESILNHYDKKSRIIIIDNPNNPTGSIITQKELIYLLNSVSKDTFVIIDEAYYEYVLNKEYPNSLKIQEDYPNLIVMRSFSKIYGLAGLRVGYTIASSEIIAKMEHFQAPFTVNHLASIACIAALSDDEFVKKSRLYNNEGRFFLHNAFASLGYKIVQSESNFLFIYFNTKEERDSVFDSFEKQNIMVRKTDYFGAENAFRITVGTPELNAEIIECINNYIK